VLRLRNKLLPLIHLKKLLKMETASRSEPENGFIVVTQVGSQTFGIVVDGVFHTEESSSRPMSTQVAAHLDVLRATPSWATARDLDHRPNGIARGVGTTTPRCWPARGSRHQSRRQRQHTSFLGVPGGSPSPRRCRLSLVTRLEEVDASKIEISSGRHMVQYRGHLMRW